MAIALPPFPDPCTENQSYDLTGTCVDGVPVYSWTVRPPVSSADVGEPPLRASAPCGGGAMAGAVTAAIHKGWPLADVLKLVAAIKK